jgi:hypothetical protein
MKIKASEVRKMAKNIFGKYVYSIRVYLSILVILFTHCKILIYSKLHIQTILQPHYV